jgi:zinc protease
MINRIFLFMAALLASLSPAFAFEAREVTSKSGLKAWLVEDHSIPLVAMDFSLEGGSASDPEGKDGRANFLSGMLNEGAGDMDGPAFQARIDELAVRMDFGVGPDRFSGALQTISSNQKEAFRLLGLALAKPTFPADSLERVRQQLLQSVQQRDFSPGSIAYRKVSEISFPEQPYSRRSLGTAQTIASLSRDDLVAAHHQLIRRSGLTVSFVGDVTPQEAANILDNVFGTLPNAAPPKPVADTSVAVGPALAVIPFNNPQTIVMFQQRGILDTDKDYMAANVMMEILGGDSLRSRLNEEVRVKRGLTYGISFDLQSFPHAGVLMGSFSSVNDKAAEALQATRDAIRRVEQDGPTQQELDEIKTYLTGSYALRFDSTGKIAGFLTALQERGRPINFANIRNNLIEAVTLQQVKDVARKLLDPDKMNVVAVGKPKGLK